MINIVLPPLTLYFCWMFYYSRLVHSRPSMQCANLTCALRASQWFCRRRFIDDQYFQIEFYIFVRCFVIQLHVFINIHQVQRSRYLFLIVFLSKVPEFSLKYWVDNKWLIPIFLLVCVHVFVHARLVCFCLFLFLCVSVLYLCMWLCVVSWWF